MPESDAIARASQRGPGTIASLTRDLRALGVAEGDTVIAHTSLSRLGWVAGGPIGVIDALVAAVGESGTVVMPTQSAAYSDPATWQDPPVPESWWATIRAETPAFDPRRTPTRGMGVVPEAFRSLPGVLRSDHHFGSFAARGKHAETITREHPIDDVFGDRSPLGRLYELGASVLLLGVGHANNTALHLAETRIPGPSREQGTPVLRNGVRSWVTYQGREHSDADFPAIGAAYAAAGGTVRTGPVGSGEGTRVPMREIVDFAVRWMVDHRPPAV